MNIILEQNVIRFENVTEKTWTIGFLPGGVVAYEGKKEGPYALTINLNDKYETDNTVIRKLLNLRNIKNNIIFAKTPIGYVQLEPTAAINLNEERNLLKGRS